MIVGDWEGFVSLISLSDFSVIVKFPIRSTINDIKETLYPNELAIAHYSGLSFLKINRLNQIVEVD